MRRESDIACPVGAGGEGTARPPIMSSSHRGAAPGRQTLAIVLSLCLGLFLADAAVSLADDSLILFCNLHLLSGLRGIVFLLAALMALVTYGLMGLTPMISKRVFLPLTLFIPVTMIASIPLVIAFNSRIQLVAWGLSFCQVLFGLTVVYCVVGGFRWRWPLVAENQLGARGFSWLNLSGFVLFNLLVVPPALIVSLFLCASLAVHHYTDGFVALRAGELVVEVREYVRDDGKTILLVPMIHIGEADFYQDLSRSFPTNAIVLMEGVTDHLNLITNEVSYSRMATSLGLAEQAEAFDPSSIELVNADVDVEEFAPETIGFMNLVMLCHSRGMTPGVVRQVLRYSPPPGVEQQLLEDLLGKRNRRLMEVLQARLPGSDRIIVPWGAAHMPEIAAAIQQAGFRLGETWEYVAIRFVSGQGEP